MARYIFNIAGVEVVEAKSLKQAIEKQQKGDVISCDYWEVSVECEDIKLRLPIDERG